MAGRIIGWLAVWFLCLVASIASLLMLPWYAWRSQTRAKRMSIAFDQLFNTLLRGYPDEMLSAKAWRMRKVRSWPVKLIDWLFLKSAGEADHCRHAYETEVNRAQFPRSYQDAQ